MKSSTSEQESNAGLNPETASIDEGTSSIPADRLVNRPNTKVAVWQCFGLETDERSVIKSQELLVGKVGSCRAQVKIKYGSMSNLYSHLRMHHPREYQAVRPKHIKGKEILVPERYT